MLMGMIIVGATSVESNQIVVGEIRLLREESERNNHFLLKTKGSSDFDLPSHLFVEVKHIQGDFI